MKLYHYSASQFSSLLTRKQSGQPLPVGVKVSDDYLNHISFFFDPIPSKLLPEIFDRGHPFWYKGHELFEHVVDVDGLPQHMKFEVVESTNKTLFLDQFIKDNNWEDDNPALLRKWNKEFAAKQVMWGEVGFNHRSLVKVIKENQDVTKYGFISSKEGPFFDEGYNKYAANVPHLMVYPPSGTIEVSSVAKLTIGSDARTRIEI